MKQLLFIAIASILTLSISAQTKAPKLNFETKSHDFGTIQEADGPATFVFKFTNIGEEPLLLKNVRASCGCTTPKWTKEPVLPGDAGEIKVTYNPRNRPGSFRKTITITSNAEPVTMHLTINGKVIARQKTTAELYPIQMGSLKAKKMHLSFFDMTNAEEKTSSMGIYNPTTNPVKVSFPELPKHVSVSGLTVPAGKEAQITFSYDASKKEDWGFVSDDISCWIDGSKLNSKIKLSATIIEDFSDLTDKEKSNAPVVTLSARKVDFGSVKRGEEVVRTFTITNTGKSTLLIHAVKSTSTILTCKTEKEKLKVGESTTVEASINTSRTKGRQYKTINIITNDPATPNITVTLSGQVL